ncbi:MAG: type 1 glutamine amidotransferase, partial [Paracoccaceae bacterium]
MKIGILLSGHIPEEMADAFGDYGAIFARLLGGNGFTFETFAVVDGVFPQDIASADGWLITGSRHATYEDHPWIPALEDFLRAAYGADVPIVGICFGHQILAQALGGKVEKFNGGWSVGATDYRLNGSDRSLTLNAWHQDQVVGLPADANVLASSSGCKNAFLVYGQRAFSIQPHPEFSPEFLEGLIDGRGRGVV